MRKVYRFRVVRLALLLLVAAPAFVAVAVSLLVQRPDSLFVWIGSIACILFFGGGFVLGAIHLPRIMRDSTALILTPEALVIRHTGRAGQTVLGWDEIEGFTELYVKGRHFVTPQLRAAAPHIARQRNPFRRRIMIWNTRCAGSPYSIGAEALRCDADELIATLVGYLEKYGRPDAETVGKRS